MPFDRETRRRLSDLSRGRKPTEAASSRVDAPAAPPVRCVGRPEALSGTLAELLPGVVREVAEGEYCDLTTPLEQMEDWAQEAVERLLAHLSQPGLSRLAGHEGPLESLLCFDIETCGLNNEPLFLVGILACSGGQISLRQYLARHYGEEAAVLAESARTLAASPLVVSYNGRTFDLPYIHNRLRYHRLPSFRVHRHLDLLPVARQRLGRSLGDCKLQTLERHLCHRERCADIPGAQIPQAYHDFVADGEAGRLWRIVEHNRYDLLTLAELVAHFIDADQKLR